MSKFNLKKFITENSIVLKEAQEKELFIEYPSIGTTYRRNKYGVYAYDEYPSHSVLAGQERRTFLDSFDNLEDAQKAYPKAQASGPNFNPPSLDHLPGDDD